jgi:hypothetical protein
MELIKWNNAKKAIAECKTIDEIKSIRDKAEAMKAYAKQIGESQEVQNEIAEIKIRAERRAGEMLKEMPREKPGEYQKSNDSTFDKKPSLDEIGVTKSESSSWQRIADIPEDIFEQHIAEVKDEKKELTTAGTLKLVKEIKKSDRIKNENEGRKKTVKDIEIRNGDFKTVLDDLKEIDAIITDPPYPKEFIQCFSDLSLYASEHLKADGFLACYSGQYNFPEVIQRLSEHLTYVWTFCLYHVGKTQLVNGVNIMCGWKPVLIFSKGKKKMRFSAYDVLESKQMEKASHEWQQSESGVEKLVEIFSEPGQLIVDPFAGSGTFLKVSKDLGRRAIGAELNG